MITAPKFTCMPTAIAHHDDDGKDEDDDDDDYDYEDDGDADVNDDDDDCPTSHLRAYTFLPTSQICLGFNLKMIEAFPTVRQTVNTTLNAPLEPREKYKIFRRKNRQSQCISRALTEGLIYPTLPPCGGF